MPETPTDKLPVPRATQHDPRATAHAQVDRCFTYHPPRTDAVAEFLEIREVAKAFGHRLVTLAPPGRELASSLTRLEEVVFHANAAIARSEPLPGFPIGVAPTPVIRNPAIVDAEYVRRLQSVAQAAKAQADGLAGSEQATVAEELHRLRTYVIAAGVIPVAGAEV